MKIEKKALRALNKMPVKTRKRFYTAFQDIEAGITEHWDIKKMKARDAYWRLRIGGYRAIYTVNMEVIVIEAGSRGDIYK